MRSACLHTLHSEVTVRVNPSFDIPHRTVARTMGRLQRALFAVARAFVPASQRTTVSVPQNDVFAKSTPCTTWLPRP